MTQIQVRMGDYKDLFDLPVRVFNVKECRASRDWLWRVGGGRWRKRLGRKVESWESDYL